MSTNKKPNISRIGIAGAGGIGAFLASNLFDYGAKRNQFDFGGCAIDIFDDDIVDASNLLHQNFYDEDIGKYKAKIVSERCFDMVKAHTRFMTKEDFKNYDVIFSAVDSMTFRKDLYEYGFEHPELFWIDGRCSSRQIGLFHSKLERKALEKVLSDSKERTGCLLDYDKKNKTSHVTPQIVAAMMTQTFLNYIREDLQLDGMIVMI
jgi:molybdopterin/thiamine biosynthesis adenylyltransferase